MTADSLPNETTPSKIRRATWKRPGQLEINEDLPREDETPQDIPPGGNIPKPPKRTGGDEASGSDDASKKITQEEIIKALANLPTGPESDWIADAYRWLLEDYRPPNE